MKTNKILILCIIILIVLLSITPIVFAGIADFTDEDAKKQTEELVKEQEQEHNNITVLKSTDNYLESLEIEGYTLSPNFDKQTLEYTIKEDITVNEINIKAKASSEKATISGNGAIELEDDKNEYRIDVTAESGAVRTYIIKINKTESETAETVAEIETEETTEIIQAEETQKNENSNKQSDSKMSIIYVITVILALLVIGFILLRGRNKKKHKKHRKH